MFDPDDFKSPQDSGKDRRKPRTRKQRPYWRSDGHWHVIAQTTGPVEHVHRIDPTTTLDHGSVITRCGIVGRLLTTPDVDALVGLCPDCHERWPNRERNPARYQR